MWEATSASSHGVFTARRILSYVLATVVAAFLWVVFSAPLTHAATDANWNGSAITYQGNSYTGPVADSTINDLSLIKDTKAYTYVDPATTGANRQIHVIYFAPGVDTSTATGAKYKTYIYQGPSSFTNPSAPTDISLTPQSASTTTGASSCNVDNGLGWIICPITKTLASGMDWVFKTLAGFLAVRPVQTGQDNVLYRAWTYMRSIANVAFVIAFLIIIYSQLTNIGLNNYSLKKLLPRLIVAAVMVNLSYFICSVAIDISNILGFSLQDIFIQIRNSLVGSSGNSWDLMSWESLSGFVLSGGALGTAGGIVLFGTLSTYGLAGSLFLLLPSLVAGLMAVLVALVVMAARQAIITLLVILAPLAFVAYLLPNTDKWFNKWRETFMTLLVLFPAFSLIFGGSQLAAAAIIQNADSINVVILGMLVQVAPLFITPMLIRLSGSTVSRIAGMVNNPNKGIIDRTRNWSKDRADNVKANRLGTEAGRGAFLKRNAQRTDHNRRVRENRRKLHESMADNRFAGSLDNARLHEAQHEVETVKKTIEERLARDLNIKMNTDPHMLRAEMNLRVTADEAATAKARIDKLHESLRAGSDVSAGAVLTQLTDRSETATRDLALTAIATQTAKRVQQNNLATSLLDNSSRIDGQLLRDYAAGVDTSNGADSALAMAVAVKRDADAKIVNERNQLIDQFNLSGKQRQQLAMGGEKDADGNFVATDKVTGSYIVNGVTYHYDFMTDDGFTRSAAIDTQLKIGAFQEIQDIVEESGASLYDYRTVIGSGIAANGLGSKGIYLSGKTIDDAKQGRITGHDALLDATAKFVVDGNFKAEDLASNQPLAIKTIIEAVTRARPNVAPADRALFESRVAELKAKAGEILDEKTPVGRNATAATMEELKRVVNEL